MRENKTLRLQIRISPVEVRMLKKLSDAALQTDAEFIRSQIRSLYTAKFGDTKPYTPRRRPQAREEGES